MQLALVHGASFMPMDKLDGVFYGDNVIRMRLIDQVDDGRQG